MWKCTPLIFLLGLNVGCSGESTPHEKADSAKDTVATVEIPQFDLSGEFEAVFTGVSNDVTFENGMRVLTVKDLGKDDSLYFQYKTGNPCEECHVELQIWKNDKYVEVVRDTGFGMGGDYIPASLFIECSKFGTPEYERLSLYYSVRQYHPVETGNKRFLCYLELK